MEVDQAAIFKLLESIPDPEIPAINIVELGIVRQAQTIGDVLEVQITPTYSGCPAMSMIAQQIEEVLKGAGHLNFRIKTVYSPAWTTDWISPEARMKLKKYGIAPPHGKASDELVLFPKAQSSVVCPFCDSAQTEKTSEFGATACKALYFCKACRQPFEYFKAF